MLFNSVGFLLFLPVVALVFFMLPQRFRIYWLLLTSYYFYMCWNAVYLLLILTSTIITYTASLLIGSANYTLRRHKRLWAVLCVVINLGILFWFKYFNFFSGIVNIIGTRFGSATNLPKFDILLPVGISFYTFQALGYTIDVYRGDIIPQKNFVKYALFVSFFPQLVAGPIERSQHLMPQFDKPVQFNYDRIVSGLRIMLFGFFKKIAVADMLALFVNAVYGNLSIYKGAPLILATLLFSVQIYCDFSGYSDIAVGTARIFGIDIMQNFRAPYCSQSMAEFWTRWHISLNTWFRDYLYIPLGGSYQGRFRNYVNIFVVFVVSGLWHGAGAGFIIWGILNGFLRVLENLLQIGRRKIKGVLSRIFLSFRVYILFTFSLIFFRSSTVSDSVYIIRNLLNFTNTALLTRVMFISPFDGLQYSLIAMYGIIALAIVCLAVVVAGHIYSYNKFSGGFVADSLSRVGTKTRWTVYIACTAVIFFCFTLQSNIYLSVPEFIYFQF